MTDPIRRRDDFEQRINDGSEVLTYSDTRYIPVHPFSDEHALLERIGARSEQCTEVDAYWNLSDDVAFVQVLAAQPNWLPAGRYRRWGKHHTNFVSVVRELVISKAVFERELSFWLEAGRALDALRKGSDLSERLSPVE